MDQHEFEESGHRRPHFIQQIPPAPEGSSGRRFLRGPMRIGLYLAALAVLAGGVAGVVTGRWQASKPTPNVGTPTVVGPIGLSQSGLRNLARVAPGPIYWAGPRAEPIYELRQISDGRYFLRYLPKGALVGSATPYAFVATFPMANAFAVTSRVAKRVGSVSIPIAGGVAFYPRASPTNIYLAFRGVDRQIEVFDPDPMRARRSVVEGRVTPVPAAPRAGTGG